MNNMLNSSTPTSAQNLAKEAKEILNPKLTKLQKKINKIKAPYNYDCGANTPCNFGVFNTKFIHDVKSRNSI